MDYANEYPVAMKAITEWIEKGSLKRKFHIVDGLDAAPGALPLLYSGGNTGKLCVAFFRACRAYCSPRLTLPGSLRFPSTKQQLSCNLCDCLQGVLCLLMSTVLVHCYFACQLYLFVLVSREDPTALWEIKNTNALCSVS